MSDQKNEESNTNPANLNDTNDENEILTLSDLLNEQREIDEVSFFFARTIWIKFIQSKCDEMEIKIHGVYCVFVVFH